MSPPLRQSLTWALEAARGLGAAHERGIIHRDLKPENIFLTTEGRVKVLDFGLAKLQEPLVGSSSDTSSPTATKDTSPGVILGTIGYMAPEQVNGAPTGARSDVFALGAVLYELLSGRRAFSGATAAQILASILRDEPQSLMTLRPEIPASVETVVRRCLGKHPSERFSSGNEVAVALETVLTSLEPSRSTEARALEPRGPYPGLSSFTEADAERFFGRESEIESLWDKLRQRPLLALIGSSGAGKTSFVRAGVLPTRPTGWGVVVSTPGAAPMRALAQALIGALPSDPDTLRDLLAFDNPEVAFRVLQKWRKTHLECLLVLDQFEELFTLNPPDAQEAFSGLLGRLAGEGDVHVLLSLRDDFLIRCNDHETLTPVFQNLTPLTSLGGEDLRRALVEPAKKEGFSFENEGLVDEMLESVEGARGALPLLAFAVARLWEKRDREKKLLTRKAYEAIGGVAGALAQHAEQTLERIGLDREPIVRELFRNLVTAQWTRAVADREELLSVVPDRDAATQVLDELIDARLLTSYEVRDPDRPVSGSHPEAALSGDGTRDAAATSTGAMRAGTTHRIEIIHESLLRAWPRLVRWQAQDEEGAVLRDQLRQAAHLWEEKNRSPDVLWTGTAFQEFELWRDRYKGRLTALENEYAQAMVDRVRRHRRIRRYGLAAAFVLLAAVAAALSVMGHREAQARVRAEAETLRAEASKIVALGRAELDRYPTAALAYARKSLEVADNSDARRLIVASLWRSPPLRILPIDHGGSWRGAFHPAGHWFAAYTQSENIILFPEDGSASRTVGGFSSPASPSKVAFTPAGDALLAWWPLDPRGIRMVSFPEGREIRWFEATSSSGGNAGLLDFAPRPQGLVLGIREEGQSLDRIEMRPWGGGPPRVLGHVRRPSHWHFRASGTRLAGTRGGRVFERGVSDDAPADEVEIGEDRRFRCLDDMGTRLLAAGDDSGGVSVWSLEGVEPRELLDRRIGSPGLHFSPRLDPTESLLAWGSGTEGAAYVWSLAAPPKTEPRVLRRPDIMEATQAVFHPRGDWLAVLNAETTSFWALQQPWARVIPGVEQPCIDGLLFTSDSKQLISCEGGHLQFRPLDASTLESRAEPLPLAPCYGAALSPDQREIIAGALGFWRLDLEAGSWSELAPKNRSEEPLPADRLNEVFYAAAYSASGDRAATVAGFSRPAVGKFLRVWEMPSGDLLHEVSLVPEGEEGHEFRWGAYDVAFLPDGRVLVGGFGGVRVFDLETDRTDTLWSTPPGGPASMAVSVDGRRLMASWAPWDPTQADVGSDRPEPVLIDLDTGDARPITSHGNRITAVAMDPSGHVIVTGDEDGALRVGLADGTEPHLLLGHANRVLSLVLSPDGKWVASSAGSEIRVWPMPDLSKPPLHTLPHDELLAKLRSFTNLEAVEDESSMGYRLEAGPFPGWKDVPEW